MTPFLAALTAVQILLSAPFDTVGTTRRETLRQLGQPQSIGTDIVAGPHEGGAPDQVVTFDYPKTRVRVYEAPSRSASHLLYVATVDDRFPTHSAVRVGVDRASVLHELGEPAYQDDDQLIYLEPRAEDPSTGDRIRIVLENSRVVGLEWSFGLQGQREG